jgi:hypothetical protein
VFIVHLGVVENEFVESGSNRIVGGQRACNEEECALVGQKVKLIDGGGWACSGFLEEFVHLGCVEGGSEKPSVSEGFLEEFGEGIFVVGTSIAGLVVGQHDAAGLSVIAFDVDHGQEINAELLGCLMPMVASEDESG